MIPEEKPMINKGKINIFNIKFRKFKVKIGIITKIVNLINLWVEVKWKSLNKEDKKKNLYENFIKIQNFIFRDLSFRSVTISCSQSDNEDLKSCQSN